MKKTAIQQAIAMVRSRIESMNNTLMGKHTVHHLQQVERELYDLLEKERNQIEEAYTEGCFTESWNLKSGEQYYKETY